MFTDIVMITYARPLPERRRARSSCGPYRWRPCAAGRGRGFYVAAHSDDAVDEPGSSFRLRIEAAANHWSGAQGWRGDWDLDAWTPIVARLNHGRGFLAGASLGRGMLAFVDPEIFAEARDAAMAADDAARAAADADAENAQGDAEDLAA
jgi:hypothetical protein